MTPVPDAVPGTDADAAPIDGRNRRFAGVARDGTVGVRNRVLVLPSVICSRIVADRIANDVPAAVAAPHDHGCGQIGADKDQTRRTFLGLAANPNVAGTVVVGLGCEGIQSDDVAATLDRRGVPVREVTIQDAGGTEPCFDRGVAAAEDLAASAATDERPADLGDLTLGIVSSDVDDATTDVADPLVGDFARAVVDAGGRVVAAGIDRLVPHADEVGGTGGDALDAALAARRDHPGRATRVRRTAADRSLDRLTRAWGDLPVEAVVDYGDRATHDGGLALLAASSRFEEAATGLAAAGAQLVVHATAEGIPTGHPVVPVLKVSGDADTVAALPDDIDVDATTADAADLLDRVRDVADGAPTAAERHGLREFAIERAGPSV